MAGHDRARRGVPRTCRACSGAGARHRVARRAGSSHVGAVGYLGSAATVAAGCPLTAATRLAQVQNPETLGCRDADPDAVLLGPAAQHLLELLGLAQLADVRPKRVDLGVDRVADIDPCIRLVTEE